MPTLHSYVKVQQRYVYLHQNPIALARVLYFNGKSLLQKQNLTKRIKDALKYAMTLTWLQLRSRLVPLAPDCVLELPFQGQICLPVSNGYKIFDLNHNVVVKYFPEHINPAVIQKEVELNLKVQSLDLIKLLQDWNIDEHWYTETYINQYHLNFRNWKAFLETLHQRIVPIAARIASATPSTTRDVLEYSQYLQNELFSETGKLSNPKLSTKLVDQIKTFWNQASCRLEDFAKTQPIITLTLTHGDLSLLHILDHPGDDVVIDWEYMNYRSAVFDLYRTFFHEWTFREPPDLSIHLTDVVTSLESQLRNSTNFSQHKPSDSSITTDLYRWVYYLEHIYQALEIVTPTNRKLHYLLKLIEGFLRYETRISS